MDQWRDDMTAAIGELRRLSGPARICLVGLRIGGTLASLVAAEQRGISYMVLWDPVIQGKAYIEELRSLHRTMLRTSHVKPTSLANDKNPSEVLGFPLTDGMRSDLEEIDLLTIREKPANRILLLESHSKYSQKALADHLQTLKVEVEYLRHSTPQFWMWLEDLSRVLVPHQVIQSIISWISKVAR
jgi:hypothetical protein